MPAGATYEPIATYTTTGVESGVTLSGISQSYTDLRVILNGQQGSTGYVGLRFNSDSGSNYYQTVSSTNGSVVANYQQSGNNIGCPLYYGSFSGSAASRGLVIWDIFNYSGSTYRKTVLCRGTVHQAVEVGVAGWDSTVNINTIILYGNSSFNADTQITVYGIKAA
jgi:hypothetical protein